MVTPGENAILGGSLGSRQRQGDSRREQQCCTVVSSVTLPVRKQRWLQFNETSILVFKNNWELRFLDPTTRVYRSCVRTKATGPSANCGIHPVPCKGDHRNTGCLQNLPGSWHAAVSIPETPMTNLQWVPHGALSLPLRHL